MLFKKPVVTNVLKQAPGSDAMTELEKYRLMVATQQRITTEYKQSDAYRVQQANDAYWSNKR